MIEVDLKHKQGNFALDVTFLGSGGTTALFGPSGSGKTTIVNAISGLIRPDHGRIVVNDRVLFDSASEVFVPPHLRRVGYVFQEPRLFPHMTVGQNLTYAGEHVKLNEIIEMLGLGDMLGRKPETLSGGEAQRVAIGRALNAEPEILLMDEPLAALDSARKSDILPYLARIRDTQMVPIIYVSHAMQEVAQFATDLVLIRDGKVRRFGPIAEILSDPAAVPDLGIQDAGAVVQALLVQKNAGDGLSKLTTSAGELFLPMLDAAEGASLRVRIQASDIILAKARPDGVSALNILPVEIAAVHEGQGPGVAVGLMSGTDRLISRITRRSLRALDLTQGSQCFAIIKTVSIAPSDVEKAR